MLNLAQLYSELSTSSGIISLIYTNLHFITSKMMLRCSFQRSNLLEKSHKKFCPDKFLYEKKFFPQISYTHFQNKQKKV